MLAKARAYAFASCSAGFILGEAALLAEDEVWAHPAPFVPAVEVALGLLVIFNLEYLLQPLQELGLARAVRTVNDHCICLLFFSQYQVAANISYEWRVLSALDTPGGLFD